MSSSSITVYLVANDNSDIPKNMSGKELAALISNAKTVEIKEKNSDVAAGKSPKTSDKKPKPASKPAKKPEPRSHAKDGANESGDKRVEQGRHSGVSKKVATFLGACPMALLNDICDDIGIPHGKTKAEANEKLYNAFCYEVCDDHITRSQAKKVLTNDVLKHPDSSRRTDEGMRTFAMNMTKDTLVNLCVLLGEKKSGNKIDLVNRIM